MVIAPGRWRAGSSRPSRCTTASPIALYANSQAKNPRATFRAPITIEGVLNSRMNRLPVPIIAVLPRDRWRRRVDPGRGERARDFPQSLPLAANRAGLPSAPARASRLDGQLLRHSRESGNPGSQGFSGPPGPRFRGGGGIIVTSSRDFRVAGPKAFAAAASPQGRRPSDDLRRPCSLPGASFAHLPIYGLDDLGFVPRAGRSLIAGHTRPRRPRSTPMAASFVHAFRHVRMYACRRACARCARPPPPGIPDTRISVCHGVAACSPLPARSSCRTRGLIGDSGVPLIEQAHREGQIVRCATLEGEKRYTCGDMGASPTALRCLPTITSIPGDVR